MSLKASGTQIVITNADGSEKFNSDNKLVYRKFTQTGSLYCAAGYIMQTSYGLVGSFNPDKDIPLVFVTINAGDGNVSSQIVGSTIQLNFSMLTNFKNSTTSAAVLGWDMLTAGVLGDSNNAALRIDYFGYPQGRISSPSSYVSLSWTLVVLSYR
jgi:hypothetical protein